MNFLKKKNTSDNPSTTVYNLLRVLNIPATYSHVEKTLQEHPDYPSLLSMAESLPDWGVNTEGVKGDINDLTDADYPSIIHQKSKTMEHDFAVLENVQDGRAKIIHPTDGPKTLRLNEFGEIWSGILLRANPDKITGEQNFKAHRKSERLTLTRKFLTQFGLPGLFFLAFGCGLAQTGSLGILIPLGLAKTVGFVLCMVMVAASLGESGMMNTLCPMGRIVNCHRVMQSPAGRIFGVSMAEWGMLYFAGGLISLLASLFFGHFINDLFVIGVLGCLILPYTLFSLIYQAFIVRSWCWMCLAVMFIFWIEFYLLYDITINQFVDSIQTITFPTSIILGFGLSALGWVALRQIITAAKNAEAFENNITRLRRHPDYIRMQLGKAGPIDMGQMPFEVEVGPANAQIVMTLVANPLCGHCWKAFNQMDKIIDVGKGKIKANIRFLVSDDDESQNATEQMLDREVSLRILSLAEQGDRNQVHKALRTWFAEDDHFSKGKFDRWSTQFPVGENEATKISPSVLTKQKEWAMQNKVFGTPTVFFGNRQLGRGLQLGDLKIFLMRQFET
ncbi:MAG: vitamin K epoxide reductase family protein [Candidatus Zixiibacteriota bacterium]